MKIYIAGPFFNEQECDELQLMIHYVKENYINAELFIPMEHEITFGENLPNVSWGKKVFNVDKTAIDECDFVVACYHGMYSDTGTAWEIGYAYGIGKPVLLWIPNQISLGSLMILNSVDEIIGNRIIEQK